MKVRKLFTKTEQNKKSHSMHSSHMSVASEQSVSVRTIVQKMTKQTFFHQEWSSHTTTLYAGGGDGQDVGASIKASFNLSE